MSLSVIRQRLRELHAQPESGFTLIELLLSMVITTLLIGALGTAFVVSYRGTEKVKTILPGAASSNGLNLWLSSDISSAVPVNLATWLSNSPTATTGCSDTPAGTTNLLRIETRDPIGGTRTYIASYRYQSPAVGGTTGSIWRTFCVTGAAPSANSVIAEDIDPASLPAGWDNPAPGPRPVTISALKDSVSLSLGILSRAVSTPVTIRAAVRVPETAPSIATSTTTTLPVVQSCNITGGNVTTAVMSAKGANTLDYPVTVTVTANNNLPPDAVGACTQPVAAFDGASKVGGGTDAECVLTQAGLTWSSNTCFGAAKFPNNLDTKNVLIYDRVDPGDPLASPVVPPTDILLIGPPASLSMAMTATLPPAAVTLSGPTPANPTFGNTVSYTVTVTGAGGFTPTGGITWTLGGPTSACATATPLVGAGNVVTATCTFAAPTAGTYAVTAAYSGDARYAGGSATGGFTIAKVTPTVTVTHTPATPTLGQSATFTATVPAAGGAPAPTGAITWTVTGAATACSTTTATTCTVDASKAGTYDVTATLAADVNYVTASGTDTVTVAKVTPGIAVTSLPASPTLGQTVTLTATVTGPVGGATPAGAMSWAGVTCSATTPLTGAGPTGTATCTFSASAVATYSITATVAADANYNAATSATLAITIPKATPTASVAHAPVTPTLGNTVVFTAIVAGPVGGPTPTGALTWTLTGPVTTCASTTPLSGSGNSASATCTIVAPKAGTYTAFVAIVADVNYNPATSAVDSFTVAKATPTISVSAAPASPVLGASGTFTATVTWPAGIAAPTVNWTGVTCTSTTPLTGTTGTSTSTCVVSAAAAQTYTATATIPATADFNTATASGSFTVSKVTPTAAITRSPATPTLGNTVTFTATFTGATGGPGPSGAVTWSLTGAVTACSPTGTSSAGNVTTATCTITASKLGTYNASASIAADTNYNGATTAVNTFTIKGTPLVAVTYSAVSGGNITFTATLTGVAGQVAPTAAVTWTLTSSLGNASCSNAQPSTTCVVAVKSGRTYTATAAFAGDGNYNVASGSNSVTA